MTHHDPLTLAYSMLLASLWENLWNAVTLYLMDGTLPILNKSFDLPGTLLLCLYFCFSLLTWESLSVNKDRSASPWSEAAVHTWEVLLPTSN